MTRRFLALVFFLDIGFLFIGLPLAYASVPAQPLVVIDPGHGGADHGAIYSHGKSRVSEKKLTLLLAKQVAEELRKLGIRAVLTRSIDKDVPLQERTGIANRLDADLFLSLHLNSSKNPHASGSETYIFNNSNEESSKRLADLENSVSTLEGSFAQSAAKNANGTDVALILKDLTLDANHSESQRLACQIQGELTPKHRGKSRGNRGVKQALFYVLLGADMPSALVEAGFITSPEDRKALLSPPGRTRMSLAIAQAISKFHLAKFHPGGRPEARRTLASCKIH